MVLLLLLETLQRILFHHILIAPTILFIKFPFLLLLVLLVWALRLLLAFAFLPCSYQLQLLLNLLDDVLGEHPVLSLEVAVLWVALVGVAVAVH